MARFVTHHSRNLAFPFSLISASDAISQRATSSLLGVSTAHRLRSSQNYFGTGVRVTLTLYIWMVGELKTNFGANNHRTTKPANVQISQGMCRNCFSISPKEKQQLIRPVFTLHSSRGFPVSDSHSQSAVCGSAPLPITCSLNGTNILYPTMTKKPSPPALENQQTCTDILMRN